MRIITKSGLISILILRLRIDRLGKLIYIAFSPNFLWAERIKLKIAC